MKTTIQKINKQIENLNSNIEQLDLTKCIECSTQQQQNTHFSQLRMKCSPEQTMLGHEPYNIFKNIELNKIFF